jgi:hypothetical protein
MTRIQQPIHYIHITKTGGTTARATLKPKLSYKHKFFHWLAEDRYYYIIDLPDDMRDMFFIVSCVRNPWDRLVSLYYHLAEKNDKAVEKYDSFQHFCMSLPGMKIARHRVTHRASELPASFNNQIVWLQRGEEIDHHIDYIMRFENFQQDLERLCEWSGLDVKIPHLNRSKHPHYTECYDNKTRHIIAKLYKRDIKTFGYRFGE